MATVSKAQLATMVAQAVARQTEIMKTLDRGDNIQTRILYFLAKGQRDALKDVQCALAGDLVYLQMLIKS